MSETSLLTKTLFTRSRLRDFNSLLGLLPNPDPVLRKKGLALPAYENILTDNRVDACMESRKSGVLSWEWRLKGGTSDKGRDMLAEHLNSIDIHSVMAQIMDAVYYGYKPLEVIWGRSSGQLLPVEVRGLPPYWFGFDQDNKLRFRSMSSPMNGELVPERKVLVAARDVSYANPYGRPLGASCFWPVTFKRGGLKFWVAFAERFGMPHLVGKVPPGTPDEQMQVVAEQLDKMVQDAIAVIEDDQHIEPLDIGTRSASSDLYRDLIRHMNDEIAVAILGQTLTTEVREGSRAAAEVHMVVRDDIAAKDRHMVAGVMDRLIRWVWELNFQGPAPTWQWIEENDPQKVWAERDDLLSRQIRFSRVYYQRRYGLQDDEFDVPSLPSSPAPAKDSRAGMFAQSYAGRTNPGQTSIDAMGDAYVDRAAEMFGQAMDPVLTAVQQATSYNDMIERLYDVHKNMDTADFQELVRRAMFAADLWGYYRAHEEAGE